MNFQERIGRYEYTIYEIKESIISVNEEIEDYKNSGQYDEATCTFLRGQLVAYKQALHSLTGDNDIFKD